MTEYTPEEETLIEQHKQEIIAALKTGLKVKALTVMWDEYDSGIDYYLGDEEIIGFKRVAFEQLWLDDILIEEERNMWSDPSYVLNPEKVKP